MSENGGGRLHSRAAAAAALIVSLSGVGAPGLSAQQPSPALPPALYTDPPHDSAHPARMEVLHIPSRGARINGIAYLPPGPGPHPTFVLLHGLPGDEKNLDLAQAVRRGGWTVVTFNYRGSWGSPGSFSFAHCLEDADAALAYLREPATVRTLGIDTTRMVLAGHSMGGWVTAVTAAHHPELRGAILISGSNFGGNGARLAPATRARMVERARGLMDSLAGVTAESLVDELVVNADAFSWFRAAPGLARIPLLLMAEDALAPQETALADSVRAHGGKRVTTIHVATDHWWSDRRIELEALVLRWLAELR